MVTLSALILAADPFQTANNRPTANTFGAWDRQRSFVVRAAATGRYVDTVKATSPGDAIRQTLAVAASHGIVVMGPLHATVSK